MNDSHSQVPRPPSGDTESLNEAAARFDSAGFDNAGFDDSAEDGLSLEELSRTYERLSGAAPGSRDSAGLGSAGSTAPSSVAGDGWSTTEEADPQLVDQQPDLISESTSTGQVSPPHPQSIVEAVLFVGKPDGGAISAPEIASLMRGVSESDVAMYIERLNSIYLETGRAMCITASAAGYRLQLADDLEVVREQFYGRSRAVKLNQAAIDCLALIAYQPGISRETLEQQRGQACGSVLSQLVRRQLVEVRREKIDQKNVQRYYPTERLLDLAGIDSLEDLPQTEEF